MGKTSDEEELAAFPPMPEFNPYAAPKTPLAPSSRKQMPVEEGLWADGKVLVMTKSAELPDLCIKCGAPAEGYRLKRNLMWHPPAWYLLILFNLIIYAIVAS